MRFGGPKQYELLGGRRVLDWAVEAAGTVADGIVLAVPPERVHDVERTVDVVVAGGETRSDSVRRALAAVPASAAVVVVHDAARPLATPGLFSAVVGALAASGVDGAIPGVPVPDTVKRVRHGEVVDTLDRAELMAIQTPQAFRADALLRAHASGAEATDDAALVEAIGGRVVVVAGEAGNAKVTTAADLEWARQRVARLSPSR